MKVFGIGISKTGTKTLGRCLRVLGFDHFTWDPAFVRRYIEGDLDHVWEVAERHESFDDWPWPVLYRELDERFPDARFVLTLRDDLRSWHESLRRHAERSGPTPERRHFFGHALPHGHEREDVALYRRHRAEVERHFEGREDKLLVVSWPERPEWEPLCRFLDRPIPDEPFPHENRRGPVKPTHVLRRVRFYASALRRQRD